MHVPLSPTLMLTTLVYQDRSEGVGEIEKGKENGMFSF